WAEERESSAEAFAARRAARRATGLTPRRINQWEDAGRDHSEYPGLDVAARELAGAYPALGIGTGYTSDRGEDWTDYAGSVRDGLGNHDEGLKPRHPPDILRRAAERIAAEPDGAARHPGPMTFSAQRWADYLARKGIPWPRLESGALALDDDTFRE